MVRQEQLVIRPEQAGDEPAITDVIRAAFAGDEEVAIVDGLRQAGALTISLVAWLGDRPVGHIAFSPVQVGEPAWPAIGLGPLAIIPGQQRLGIGGALTRLGLAHCLARDYDVVFLLGHTEYYPRFGFRPGPAIGLTCKWSTTGDHFMVAELREGALAGRQGLVQYHPAFG